MAKIITKTATPLSKVVAIIATTTLFIAISFQVARAVDLCGPIATDTSVPAGEHTMSCQAFVKAGATLTIAPGATIKASTTATPAAALVVEQGGKIVAEGTRDAPITFTADAPASQLPARGLWGGVIVNGYAPTSHASGVGEVEGLVGVPYGGTDPNDDSGVLKYVRIWYGGAVIGQDNEINGLTLAGVGDATTVEYVEVAFNLDDGIELFGGTVNLKYVVVLFAGDDGIDTDHGYQGKIQFAFVMVGSGAGHHGVEMDSKTDGDLDSQPRSHPQLYNALFVGSNEAPSSESSDDQLPSIMRLREGTGGQFGNIVMTNVGNGPGVLINDCGSEALVQDMTQAGRFPDFLYFSQNNIINTDYIKEYMLQDKCAGIENGLNVDPELTNMPVDAAEAIKAFDPRPVAGGNSYKNVDSVPKDKFFTPVDYKGAFGSDDLWISGWSWLSADGRIPTN